MFIDAYITCPNCSDVDMMIDLDTSVRVCPECEYSESI